MKRRVTSRGSFSASRPPGSPADQVNPSASPGSSPTARGMDLPDLGSHELRGARKGTWAVKVSGNWRIRFTVDGKDIANVDHEDYH